MENQSKNNDYFICQNEVAYGHEIVGMCTCVSHVLKRICFQNYSRGVLRQNMRRF